MLSFILSPLGKYAIVALLAFMALWSWGNMRYRDGQRDLLADIEKARTASIEEKAAIEAEIGGLSDEELLRRALGAVRAGGR